MKVSTDPQILDSLNPQELGGELSRARKRRGLTQEEAAKVIEVARTTITAIEKGDRKIRSGELIKLARAYGQQVSDFVRPRPIVEPFVPRIQFRGPFGRTELDDKDVEPFIESFEELCRDYLELEQLTQSPHSRRYPPEAPLPRSNMGRAAESLAQEERNRLGLGDGPIAFLRDVLEQEVGLRVFFIDMPSRFSEMYICDDTVGGCIAINRNHPEERRRWSMAHAYAHFLTSRSHSVISTQSSGGVRTSDAERFGDLFPSPFLMPTAGLLRRVTEIRDAAKDKLPISDVFRVAHRFGVSPQAMVRRLEDLRLLPSGTWDGLSERVSVRNAQERLGLTAIAGRDELLPVRYRQLAFFAYDEGLISEGRLARFLRVDKLEARRLIQEQENQELQLSDATEQQVIACI